MDTTDLEAVIKVRYGGTLRRLRVSKKKNGYFDLDMAELRAKICNLFKFSPDADFILTYQDKHNGTVPLVDDFDLCDVIKQCLYPLRISVHFKTECDRDHSLQAWSVSLSSDEAVTERIHWLTTLVKDLLPKFASVVPLEYKNEVLQRIAGPYDQLIELVEFISKLGKSNQDSVLDHHLMSKGKENSIDGLNKSQDTRRRLMANVSSAAGNAVINKSDPNNNGKMDIKETGSDYKSASSAASARIRNAYDGYGRTGNTGNQGYGFPYHPPTGFTNAFPVSFR